MKIAALRGPSRRLKHTHKSWEFFHPRPVPARDLIHPNRLASECPVFPGKKQHNFTWTHKFVDPILYKQQLFFAGFSIREECFFRRICCLLTANVIEIGKLPVPAARLDCWYYFRAIFWTHYLRFRHSLQWFECHSWVHKGEMNENHQQCSGCKNSGNWSPSVRIPIFWKPQIQGGLIAQRLGL